MQPPYHDNDEASTLGSKSFDGEGGDSISNGSNAQGFIPSNSLALPRIVTASDELESLCRAEMSGGNDARILGFPPTCLPIVRLLAGNHCCVDCGDEDQDRLRYASIGYGTLLCQECAHRHAVMSEGVSADTNYFTLNISLELFTTNPSYLPLISLTGIQHQIPRRRPLESPLYPRPPRRQ